MGKKVIYILYISLHVFYVSYYTIKMERSIRAIGFSRRTDDVTRGL